MKITVQLEHIRNGVRKDATMCAIALAAKEIFGQFVSVKKNYFYVYEKEGWAFKKYSLPKVARKFESDFDEGEPVTPITFTARLLDEFHLPA